MTEQEKNRIGAALLTFAQATERLMTEFLKMQGIELHGKPKMLYNSMVRSVKSARFYYEQFTNTTASVLANEDKDFVRADHLRQDADSIIRIYLRIVNVNNNNFSTESVEDALKGLCADGKREMSEEVINKFNIKVYEKVKEEPASGECPED